MFSTETLSGFVIASFLLGLSPGPDNFYVMSQASLYGVRAGLSVTLGLCTGLLIHTSLVAFGVAAVIMASTLAFTVLQIIGVAYLLYLAWRAFGASMAVPGNGGLNRLSISQYYQRGIIMNVSNPKVGLFFLAFLPQFTNLQQDNLVLQVLCLGTLFIVTTLLVFGGIALLAARLETWLRRSPKAQIILNRIVALVFLGVAIKLILIDRPSIV